MGLVHKCPYYKSDKKKTISCESRLHWFRSVASKRDYILKFCCDRWSECDYARSLSDAYDKGTVDKTVTLFQEKEIKRLLQQVGMYEKTISHMEEIAAINYSTYDRERRRFSQCRRSDSASIKALEECIAMLLTKLHTDRISMDEYARFRASHDVSYHYDEEKKEAVYMIRQKGGNDGDKGSSEEVSIPSGIEILEGGGEHKK